MSGVRVVWPEGEPSAARAFKTRAGAWWYGFVAGFAIVNPRRVRTAELDVSTLETFSPEQIAATFEELLTAARP